MRAVWKGAIRFSLVTIPVEAYTAAEPAEADIHLNQLHEKCHSRIKYQKTCPIHGEVSNDEIVTGYEYQRNHYVVIDRKEIEKAEKDHSIAIETFIDPEEIDPMYYDGHTYFLAPGTKSAQQPYNVFREAMEKRGRCGIATVTLTGKSHPVIIRAVDNILTMAMLHYKDEIRKPEIIDVPKTKTNPQELKLAEQLIDASTTDHFDFGQFEDTEKGKLKELIQAKIKGKEIVSTGGAEEEAPDTINLMDALRKSMRKAKRPERKRKKA